MALCELDGAEDIACLRVLKGIGEGLSGYHFHLILHDSMKTTRPAFNGQAKISCKFKMQLLLHLAEGIRQRVRTSIVGSQVSDTLAAFDQKLIGVGERFLRYVAERLTGRDGICHQLKTKNEHLNTLEQGIVEFSRDAIALH